MSYNDEIRLEKDCTYHLAWSFLLSDHLLCRKPELCCKFTQAAYGEYHTVKNKSLANSQQSIKACEQPCERVWNCILAELSFQVRL